eukprot:sb/3461695/
MSKRWSSISEGELVRLEGFIVQKAQQPSQAQFITLKYCKVYVNMAIRRSPDLNCIGDIVKIVQSGENCSVGVTMLQLLSEEITKPRPDLHPNHHGKLKSRLSQCVSSILSLLCEQLEKRRSVEASLACLAHYLSWAPVTDILKPSLLSTVFLLVREALENGQQEGAGVAGVSCVNEIVGRNQVPSKVQEFIMGLFKETLQLLSQITEQRIELESGFHKKLIEFLALFTGGHFRRVESNPSFPVLDFLALLFKFTVSQNDPQFFIGSVDVCSSWVDFLLLAQGSLSPDGAVPRYGSALDNLTRLLLHKITYEGSKELLDQISRDDERPSEWDHFMGKITQLLSKVIFSFEPHLHNNFTDILKPSLLSTVFLLVREALENGQQEGAGVAGVSCVNEIVGRNQVPSKVQEFIMGLFKETLQLLSQITEQRIELESGFHKKLIEFLALFTGGHFRRVESNPSFPVLDFLALLFKFTVSQNDPQFFIGSVDVCSSWVDFLLLAQGSLSPDGAVPRYGSALDNLTRLLLHKVTYEGSKELLDQISRDDERPSEWDHFMGKITQLLSKIVELNPLPVSQIILELLDRKVSRLPQITDKEGLLDVATALHVTQVTLPSVAGEHLHTRSDTAKNIIQYGVLCFKTASSRIQEPCYDVIGESAVRLLATFAQWASAAGPTGGDILRGVLEVVVPSLTSSPVRVQQCIADLVHTTILLSRSEALLSCPSTQLLYTITVERSVKDQTALSTITKALTLLLVLPWQQTKEQRWEERATHFEEYTGKLFAPLQTVSADSEELVSMLTSLSDMVTCVAHRETKSKQLVCRAILAPARHVLSILPQVRSIPKASERLLSFATVLCDSLRVQLGVQFLQELGAWKHIPTVCPGQGYLSAARDLLVAGTVGLVEEDVEELVVQVVRAGDDLDIRSFMENYLGKYLPGDVAGRVAAPVDRSNLRETVRSAVRETRFYLSYQV